jgi:dipeptidyl aminopeptidase/acylaminoacyl peptidase
VELTAVELTAEELTAVMVADLRSVTSVALDPAGEQAAYVLAVPGPTDDGPGGSSRELWVTDLETRKNRRLTNGSVGGSLAAPAWTHDGKRLTFLMQRSDLHSAVQIYSVRRRGGEPRLLTRHPDSVLAYRLSGDGQKIAFTARDPLSDARVRARKAGHDQHVYNESPRYRRLYLFDLKSKKSYPLTASDEVDVLSFEWATDGTFLVVQATSSPSADDDYMRRQLYTIEARAHDAPAGKLRPLTTTPGKLGAMAVSPDGRHLAYLGATSRDDPAAQSLFVVAFSNAAAADQNLTARNLTPAYEGSVVHVAFLDATTLWIVAVEKEHHVLSRIDLRDGHREVLAKPPLVLTHFDLQPSHDLLAMVAHSASHPRELYIARADGNDARRFGDHNEALAGIELGRQEVIEWTGAEDWTIQGVLTYPTTYEKGKRYPLVLQLHGGPEGVSLNGWTTTATYPVQLLAQNGFLVLQPNYRGSLGRGVLFSKADQGDLGGKEMEDILRGIDTLVDRGLADPRRVGTGGWSYGGYLSAWAATRWSERFGAAVVGAGISNWIAFSGTTDIPSEMASVHWLSWWHDEMDLHLSRSPLAHLHKAATPTLILHGERDRRVHPEQGLELYTALRFQDVPVRFVTYPREGHGLAERAHKIDAIERVLAWFGKHLERAPEKR